MLMAEINTRLQWLAAKLKRLGFFLRLRPFDVSNVQGRADERHRRIVLTALVATMAKGVSALTGFISLPLTWHYLNSEQQGIWQTFSQIIIFMGFADLGIGSGLLNRISEAHAEQDRPAAQRIVSSAFFMLLAIGAGLFLVFVGLYPHLKWANLLHLESSLAIREAGPAAMICAACFALNLPLGIVTRIQLGHQEGFINSLWSMAGNLLGLIAVLTAISYHASLPWLVLGLAGGPVVAQMLNGSILFFHQRPWLWPRWRDASLEATGLLMRLGSVFFIIQMASSLAYYTDNFIIGHQLNQSTVANYSAVAKMFSLAPMLMEMFLSPLWPAYNEAMAREDFVWVKKTYLRSLKLVLGVTLSLAVVLVIGGGPILRLWTRQPLYPSFSLLLGFALWSTLAVAGSATAMFLNGTGAIRFQAGCSIAMGIVALLAKVFFCRWFGPLGVVWATALSYFFCIALPMAFFVPKLILRMQTRALP